MEQCYSFVDSCLYRVRIKFFTSVPSANAKLGQLILLQCLNRNFAVSPNFMPGGSYPAKLGHSMWGAKLQVLAHCLLVKYSL